MSAPALPALSTEQRSAALAKALEARRARSALLRKVAEDGADGLRHVLSRSDAGDHVAQRIPVLRLLQALPRIGSVRSEQLMKELGIADTRRVRGLGARQRAELLAAVDGR
ncbi:integration host factor, actinobacterial type [Streptacidiphilus sp. ASG 303]|uniref:integration host factor, actinobacterial type n=1 Tax=Streptomycetaceae TaxID=2062 RepID=UPI001E58B6AB|nr:integration host factor, actinobacterial type [Streptacidiphilus sp. ASG 303]MCD0486215.1 hypothetical protein [Streptacidiphilus sp. ASG 303]